MYKLHQKYFSYDGNLNYKYHIEILINSMILTTFKQHSNIQCI
ncbi:unnamed protein product (macronuclear) [Paramecium tetraurelia]|uniref:Uncharacterized protein n=1 Tax=Paramecium tetraurelia TaxID=5888 RepID=A0BPH8_PARTE|nr:uncharacterized protein GSPATT00005194001 [Paramecium tetraurelia]CAK60445.1 unnamed protein product [Paramecium tetraurelia]